MRCDKKTPVGTKAKLVEGPQVDQFFGWIWTTKNKPFRSDNEWMVWVYELGNNYCFPVKYLEVVDERDE
jgi:hypothetical protein